SAGPTEAAADNSLSQINEPASLFDSDYHYAKTVLTQLNLVDNLCQWTPHDAERLIAITAPRDLQERLRQLPREVQADNDYYTLCADPKRMAEAIESARQAKAEEDTWPKLHYLWPQHPIMEWLGDRVLTHFGRHRAPLLLSPHLEPGEQAFIMMSLVPNRKGQPLLVDWRVATRRFGAPGAGEFVLESFDVFVARARLKAGKLPNPGQNPGLAQVTQSM
ncbi:MAG: ATP-dependent helicase, partial [Burkholderiales bacterium]|nr:ATP-dependent helicase [Burkholderiales bacterium]